MKYLLTIILFMSMNIYLKEEKEYKLSDVLMGNIITDKTVICLNRSLDFTLTCANYVQSMNKNFKVVYVGWTPAQFREVWLTQ